ncbi:MAG TPA: FTR1 family protein [Rubrobacteraceae bacterium]|nr:FTR1 family protein [Rubrobacteraceae bacterium]
MLGSFLVMLREGFEASLLVAIVLAYLTQTGRKKDARGVWLGVGGAALISMVTAGVLFATAAGLEGTAGVYFKSGTMWLAVTFLTYMVLWMRRQSRTMAQGIRRNVDSAVERGGMLALAMLVFVMVLREGIETGLFMFGITQNSTPLGVGIGAVAGIAAAVGLGYAVYIGGKRINLGAFFKITGVLLIVVAAGLLARGIAMVEIGGIIPAFFYPIWDLSSVVALTSASVSGQFLTTFLGWDAKPDLLEVGVWMVYLLTVGYAFLRPHARKAAQPARTQAETQN